MPTITISDIAEWVAIKRLRRPELVPDSVEEAMNFYYVLCERVPFEALQYTSSEQPMVSGTATYSIGSITPKVGGIVAVSITYNSLSKVRLRRGHVRAYEAMRSTPSGRPYSYSRWGRDQLEFFPPPNSSSYTFRLRYWSEPTPEVEVGDTVVVYPTAWAELHRYETLYRIYGFTGDHDKAQLLIQPAIMPRPMRHSSTKKVLSHEMGIIPRLWNDLLRTYSQRENVDEDFSINPIVRPYTSI